MGKKRRNSNYRNIQQSNSAVSNSARTKRNMIIFVCILLAIAIVAGATIGVISAVKNANALMYIDGVSIDLGVANYLASYYKAIYVTSLRKELAKDNIELYDTPEFWNSYANSENTYGEALSEFVKSLVSQTVGASKIFDDYTTLSDNDRQIISTACQEKLMYAAGGSKAEFSAQTTKYGFDYSDFEKATEILYKSWAARIKIFGNNGEAMAEDEFSDFRESYYNNYNSAVLLFVRPERVISTDSNGNKIYDNNGYYVMKELSEEERAERQRRLAEIREAISGINDGSVDPVRFYELWESYDEGVPENSSGTYYFMTDSAYTENFPYQEIVSSIKTLEVGECVEVSCDIGVCFALKLENEQAGYTLSTNEKFFTDFYSLAAGELYTQLIGDYTKRVEVREKWSEVNVIEIPYNTDFVAEF